MTEPGIVAPGPLVVSTTNPRYFAVRSTDGAREQLVYLTGSHINNNFHDGLGFGHECPGGRSGSTSTAISTSLRRTATISSGCGLGAVQGTAPDGWCPLFHDAQALAANRPW